MFAGCSEVRIITKHVQSAIVKHVQHVGIIRAFSLPRGDLLRFSMPGETEKIAGLWFARGGSVPMLTLWLIFQRLFNND